MLSISGAKFSRAGRIANLSLLLLATGLTVVLAPLIEGQSRGWPLWIYGMLAAGAIVLVIFTWWEHRGDRRGRLALVPPRLFRHPAFAAGSDVALWFFAAFVSVFYVLALLRQAVLGHSALATGVLPIPFAVGSILGALCAGKLDANHERSGEVTDTRQPVAAIRNFTFCNDITA